MEDTEHKTRDDTETVEVTEEEMMNVDDKEEKGRVSNRLQLIGMTTFGFPASMVLNGGVHCIHHFVGWTGDVLCQGAATLQRQ